MRENGRKRERMKQGPYESKDEVGEGMAGDGRGRTLWREPVYAGGMGESWERVSGIWLAN